jgi:hypothetical protein
MASEAQRYITGDLKPAGVYAGGSSAEMSRKAVVVLATDHDRVVAEARELLRDAKVTAQVHMSCQVGVIPRCRCQSCVHERIDAWLEKTKS